MMERSNEVNVLEDVVGFVPNTDTGSKLGSGMVSLISLGGEVGMLIKLISDP